MIAALLGWTKLAPWIQELIVILVVALAVGGGMWYYGHVHYEAGIQAQKDVDAAAAAKQMATLQAKATAAEQAYDTEVNRTANYSAANPLEPVRLCITTRPLVPTSAAVHRGQNPGPTPAGVQQVPPGDSGLQPGTPGRDISGLLDALAQSADSVSASLREFQNR